MEHLTLIQATKVLPGRPYRGTLLRWILKGVLLDGKRVRLAAVRRGGRWFVTDEALDDFQRATTPQPQIQADEIRTHDRPRWRRDVRSANYRLAEARLRARGMIA